MMTAIQQKAKPAFAKKWPGLAKVFSAVFLAVLLVLFFASFFFPNSDLIDYHVPLTVLWAAILLCLLWGADLLGAKLPATCFFRRHTSLCVALILLCFLPLQGFLYFHIYYQPGWDVSILTESGYWLSTNQGIPTNYYSYFACYPNNLTLLMLWAYYFKFLIRIFGYYDYLFAAIMLSAVLVDIALFTGYRLMARVAGRRRALLAGICAVPLVAFAPWMTNPYSDTMSLLFPILALDLFERAQAAAKWRGRLFFAAAAGICVGFGTMIKPTVMIMLIAIGIGVLLCIRGKKALLSSLALLLCAAVCCGGVTKGLQDYGSKILADTGITADYVEQVEYPITHFLMMGMQKQPSMFDGSKYQYGKWRAEDMTLTFAQSGQKAKIAANLAEIKSRLSTFGVGGYLKFLLDKARWVLGDGSMYFGGEILDNPTGFQNSAAANFLQSYSYYNRPGYRNFTVQFLQGVWMVVLGLCVVQLAGLRRERTAFIRTVLRLAVCGIILFILLFEGRSRYLINYLPVFLALSAYGFPAQAPRWKDIARLWALPAPETKTES